MPYKNLQKRKEFMKEYYSKNRDRLLSNTQKRYRENVEQKKEYAKNYYNLHKEEPAYKLRGSLYAKNFRQNNKGLINSWTAKRRAKIKQSIDDTADLEKIREFYVLAESLTENTGVQYVVDHIKPIIRGGKHHQDNLQVITALDNARKGYKYPFPLEVYFNPSMDAQTSVA